MFQFYRHSKKDMVLTTDGGSDQTTTHIMGQQCVRATGAGAGVPDNGKGVIVGAAGQWFVQLSCWSAVSQLFESKTQIETGTNLYVELKRLSKFAHHFVWGFAFQIAKQR
jgi:hypothetical protein